MAIQKVVKNSISQQVFDQLRQLILDGTWKQGEKLPSENDLGAQFGVSRVTIRNALQRLSGLGLVQTRFGEGSFVCQPDTTATVKPLIPLVYLGDDALRDVLQFRRMIEGSVCESACRMATERDITALRTLCLRMEESKSNPDTFARYDYDFHCTLARITQNKITQQIYQIMEEAIQSSFRLVVQNRGSEAGLYYHKRIVKAFENHDSTRAKALMELYMEELFMVSSIYQNVINMETQYAERVAIRYYDEAKKRVRAVRYREYAKDIRRFVAHLKQEVPNTKGRHIAVLAQNSYHYAVSLFGTILAGAVFVPLNLQKSWDEICYELKQADVTCILHDGVYATREPELLQSYGGMLLDLDGYVRCSTLAELEECDDWEALALILFTSGTTGRSKGVMLSQKNLFAPMKLYVNPFDDVRRELGLGEDYAFSSFNLLPMFHVAALTSLISWSIGGNTVNLCTEPRHFYRDLKAMPSDVMAVVPVLLKSIHHDVVKGNRQRLGKLRILTCGAATYDPQMLHTLIQNGFHIIQMYGLTETVGDGAWNPSQSLNHLGSVGLCDPDCEYRLDDGELCIKGAPVMMGYYNDPEATAAVLQDGWFHTGDLARIDEDGYIYLTGRKKNLIILSSGENISPEELEKLLERHPRVREVLVHEEAGKICAEIVCGEERQQDIRRFITELNRTLPHYKRVTLVHFHTEPLPRTASGKLVREG